MHTTIYDQWDVVVVPFPFTDSIKSKPRPALVLSSSEFNLQNQHSVMAMITRAAQTKWFNDIEIQDEKSIGLNGRSFIRLKIFTLDNRLIKKKIGQLAKTDKELCLKTLKKSFAL